MGIFGKLFSKEEKEARLEQGLEKTKESLFSKLTKAIAGKSKVDDEVLDELEEVMNSKYKALSYSVLNLLEDFSMINFVPLDTTKFDNLIEFFTLVNHFYESE